MRSPREPFFVPDGVLAVLGRLGSESFQCRWITNATREHYALASDLLEDVGVVARWAGTANTMPGIRAVAHAFLAEYYRCLDTMPDAIDVENDAVWQRLRFAAARMLYELGHELRNDME